MSSNRKIAEFPEAAAKLQKPTKQSAFEKQRAEAEAKRRREAAETAAVYEDFVKSFDQGDDDGIARHISGGAPRTGGGRPSERPGLGGPTTYGGTGKRHFGAPSGSLKSGPGSLGAAASSFGKRKGYEGSASWQDDTRGRLGFEDSEQGPLSVSRAFDASDDENESDITGSRAEEKAISKPTLQLANLPPNTSPAAIKALIPTSLRVEKVKIIPPGKPSGTERKSPTAIVTLAKDTQATEIDNAVSALQNRYLGFGFYLSLHRHLSSATIASTSLQSISSSSGVLHPFGAKRVTDQSSNQGPPSTLHGRNFAPPSSYGPGGHVNRGGILHVPIQPPKDIRKLRMIHKVIESVLEHGLEFEALLMSRPEVQREEKWAWLWDARSEGGIWYRWRLWQIMTGSSTRRGQARFLPLFEGSHAWRAPDQPLPYEYTTAVDDFVSDSEYNSSDDDESEEDQRRPGDTANNDQEDMFLNPIEKCRLVHLLARLPTSLSRIRKGDIARITAFAITHASRGADEIAELIGANVVRPFAHSLANPAHKKRARDADEGQDDVGGTEDKGSSEATDPSGACLVGLYAVSDILSCSSTSGVRHAWRYRQLFESVLRHHKTFETLGMMAEKHNWGRLRAEKWKRSIGLVLSLWEGWCVFPVETHEFLVHSFEDPPALKKQVALGDAEKKAGKWKTIDVSADNGSKSGGFRPVPATSHVVQGTTDDANGYEQALNVANTDSDAEGWAVVEYSDSEPLLDDEEDLDGEPLVDFRDVHLLEEDASVGGTGDVKEAMAAGREHASPLTMTQSRKRMRAVDMFDSGSEEEAER